MAEKRTAIQNRFNFVGNLVFPKETARNAFIVSNTTKSGAKSLRLNLGVKTDSHNMAFCELFDFERDKLEYTVNGEKFSIDWDDRFEADNISKAPYGRIFTVDFGDVLDEDENPIKDDEGEVIGGRKQFLSGIDMIKFIKKNIKYVESRLFLVSGQVSFEPYKDKVFTKYKIQTIKVVPDDTKIGLYMNLDLYFTKESLDKSDWRKEQIIGLDAYVDQYINKDEGNKYIPHRVVLNCSKVDMKNENLVKRVAYQERHMTAPSKKVVHMPWKCKLISGSEEVELTIDMLTKNQREAIELGLKTLDDFKKSTFGDRIVEYRLISPMIEVEGFEDGVVELDETIPDFKDSMYIFTTDEKLEDVMNVPEIDNSLNISDDEIFG